jgi:hypothetical protein
VIVRHTLHREEHVPSVHPADVHSHRYVWDAAQGRAVPGPECALGHLRFGDFRWYEDPTYDEKTPEEAADLAEI